MVVYLKPVAGTPKSNLERAKYELTRVLGVWGDVVGTKAEGSRIIAEIVLNAKWEASLESTG
jgi:hypothetical protein